MKNVLNKIFDANVLVAIVVVASIFAVGFVVLTKEVSFENGFELKDKPAEVTVGDLKFKMVEKEKPLDGLARLLKKDGQIIKLQTFDGADERNTAMAGVVAELVLPLQNNKKKIGIFGAVESPKDKATFCANRQLNVTIGGEQIETPKETCVEKGSLVLFGCDSTNNNCENETIEVKISNENALTLGKDKIIISGTHEWLFSKRVDFGQVIGLVLTKS